MPDLNALVNQVHSYFQSRYGGGNPDPATGSLFLAFEQIGTCVSPSDFKCNATDTNFNPAIAQQHGSHLVDFVANLTADGSIQPRGDLSSTVQGAYQNLLNSAKYRTADAALLSTFMTLKGKSLRQFDEQKANMDMVDYWPAQFTPQFWFDESDSQNWSVYASSSGPEAAAPPLPPPPVLNIEDWKWRVVTPEARPVLTALRAETACPVLGVATPAASLTRVAPAAHHIILAAAVAQPEASNQIRPVLANRAVLNMINLPQVPPNSDHFSLCFEYCIVSVARPWFSGEFLSFPNWYLPGESASSLCGGTYDLTKQRFAFLPAKMLVIRKLKIEAQWSPEDRARFQDVAGFGPFSLLGATLENDVLVAPGMQIVGWMCQIMPPLPPAADPALT